jgi:hypothetical protein
MGMVQVKLNRDVLDAKWNSLNEHK